MSTLAAALLPAGLADVLPPAAAFEEIATAAIEAGLRSNVCIDTTAAGGNVSLLA